MSDTLARISASIYQTAVGIKLVPADSSNLKFTWSKNFEFSTDAIDKREIILNYITQQKPKIFSVIDYGLTLGSPYKLYFTFKFHPENVV